MKLRITLDRPGAKPVDLAITYDSSATVADVAEHLLLSDPTGNATDAPAGLTLAVEDLRDHTVEPSALLSESGIHSGQVIRLTRTGDRLQEQSPKSAAAYLVVHEGPDRGHEFPLASGSNVVGRGRSCDVRLTDSMVSRQHVRINVTDHAEVIDMGSANGVHVNDVTIEREPLQATDKVGIGDTLFTIRMVQQMATQGRIESTAVAFIRSPRLVKIFPGRKFAAPEIPERPQPQRFPILVLIAPVLMAGVMYWFTQQALTLLFMALSPLMLLGSYFEQKFSGKASFKRALKQWREDVAGLVVDVTAANEVEVASRLVEHPSLTDCLTASRTLTNLLWTRRTDSPGFAEFRLGLGDQPSRTVVEMPDAKKAPRDVFADLVAAVAPLAVVHSVPVVASPAQQGGLGIAGPRSASAAVARAIVVQAATLHSPEELSIAAVASARTAQDWEWLKWLPHCHGANSPLAAHLAATGAGANSVLGSVEELIATRAQETADTAVVSPAVLLVVESDAPAEFGRLVDIAEVGWRHGVYVLWEASELTQLPAACRVFLDVRTLAEGEAGYLHTGDSVSPVQVEPVSIDDASAWAKGLAPISDLAARTDDASDVPRSVNLLSLAGFDPAINPQHVIERWQANRSIVSGPMAPEKPSGKVGNLRAVIGQSAMGPHSVDLRADGPHALVGGTTGSGKSELLQTWILAMAASHSPQRLNFLLVDYKGGSAFADCNNLPHTVGLVTDLAKNGARRALTSLAAELRYRERLITEKHRCKDLPMMEKMYPAEAPPSLVIVVDEFAALIDEVPEFLDGVINVAQRGRSLGLHMILATQQPSGVIKGALRANTNLRLALRVSDVDDSNDILGSPQAALFDQDTPGRAVTKTGPGRLVPFQTGYVGGHSGQVAVKADPTVEDLLFGQGAPWERRTVEKAQSDRGPTDISRIVTAVQSAHAAADLPIPRKPWLPDLKAHYDLSFVPTRRSDSELVFGMLDDPDHQQQIPVAFRPDLEGNLIVYGASGSGKTTFLRTLAVSAGFTIRGGPCHVYGLDFASGGLSMLSPLPHVGSIISGSDDERVQRLLRWLQGVITERSGRYRAVNASNISEYRQLAQKPHEPRILLLVDGIAAFRTAYDGVDKFRFLEVFNEIAAQGRASGIHVILTSDQRGGLSTALASTIQRRVVMRMADVEDYGFLGVSPTILSSDSTGGRCVIDDAEVQVAVLGQRPDAQSQAVALEGFGTSMRKSGASEAPGIQRLPEHVSLPTLTHAPGLVTLGMDSETFSSVPLQPVGPFVVTGPSGSGRTCALETLVTEMKALNMPVHVLSDRRSVISSLDALASTCVGAEAISVEADTLSATLASLPITAPRHAVIIEGLGELSGTEAEYPLANLIRSAIAHDHFVVGEGEVNSLGSAYELMKRFKAGRRGIVLQPDDGQAHLLQTTFPRCKASDFVPGRGFLVEKGQSRLVQVASTHQQDG